MAKRASEREPGREPAAVPEPAPGAVPPGSPSPGSPSPGQAPRGRPAATTRATIEEAAAELFLEQGFAATNVDEIARRAGVSRSSFFNYFAGKRDVLWGPVVRELERFPQVLEHEIGLHVDTDVDTDTGSDADADAGIDTDAGAPPGPPAGPATRRAVRIVSAAILALAGDVHADAIPVPVAQAEFMGVEREVLETGSVIVVEQVGRLHAALRGLDPAGDPLKHGTLAWAIAGAVLTGAQTWVGAGPGRGPLQPLVADALEIATGCATRPGD